MDNKNGISSYDLFASIVVTVVGTSIFSSPSELTNIIGTDAWIAILLSYVILCLILYLLYKSIEVNRYDRLIDIMHNNFGTYIGNSLAILFVVGETLFISYQMRVFSEVTKMYLLKKTPTEFILILMIFIGSFLVRGELESIVKFNEIVFWIMFVPILLAIAFALNGVDFSNILPIATHEPMEYLKATKIGFFSFLGFGGIMYMLLPYLKNKKKSFKITFKSLSFIVVFYLIIIISSICIFTEKYTSQLIWPSISMISTVDIPGSFIEKWEGVAMIFWFLFYFTTYVNIYYFSAEIIRDVFKLGDVKISLMLLIPFIYIIALYPENITELYDIQSGIMPYIDTGIVVLLPIILLIIAFFKVRRIEDED